MKLFISDSEKSYVEIICSTEEDSTCEKPLLWECKSVEGDYIFLLSDKGDELKFQGNPNLFEVGKMYEVTIPGEV